MVTEKPLTWSNLAREAAIIPFPSDEVTPPVTKTYLVFFMVLLGLGKSTNNVIYGKLKRGIIV